MAKTKISKVAKDLNVALPTVIDFLRKKDITIDEGPNARIEDDVLELLVKEFKGDKDLKSKSNQFTTERQKDRVKPAAKEGPRPTVEIKLPSETNKPKIIGKIELDRHGNPIANKVEKAAAEVKEQPKAVQEEKPVVTEKAPVAEAAAAESAAKSAAKEQPAAPATQPASEPAKEATKETKVAVKETEKKDIPADKPEPVKTEPAKPAAVKPEQKPEQKAETPQEEKPAVAAKDEEIFKVSVPQSGLSINVVGKIDLSAINLSLIHI